MDCMQCGNEFVAKRSTAKYCSDRCRWLAHNAKDAPTLKPNAKDEAERIIKNAKATPTGKVSQAEIDALPQSLKDDINRLCDSDPTLYDDRDERLIRAVLYRRKFPGKVYHSNHFTGQDGGVDVTLHGVTVLGMDPTETVDLAVKSDPSAAVDSNFSNRFREYWRNRPQ